MKNGKVRFTNFVALVSRFVKDHVADARGLFECFLKVRDPGPRGVEAMPKARRLSYRF